MAFLFSCALKLSMPSVELTVWRAAAQQVTGEAVMTRYPCTMPWDVDWSVFSPRARFLGDAGGGPLLAPLDAKSWQEQNIDSTPSNVTSSSPPRTDHVAAVQLQSWFHLRMAYPTSLLVPYDPGGI